MNHRYRTYSDDTLRKSTPTFDRDREAEERQREADLYFRYCLAVAIARGDNIPAGQPKPLRLFG